MPLNYWGDDPEFIGSMPIKQEIEVLPADDFSVDIHDQVIISSDNRTGRNPRQLVLGWKVTETIGVGVVNTRGVAAGKKSTVVGK